MSDAPRIERFSEPSGTTARRLAQGVDALVVTNTVGAIALRGSERDDVRIAWVRHGEPGAPGWDDVELEIAQAGNRIAVRPRHRERGFGPSRCWIDFDIEVPARAGRLAIELENGAGEVAAEGVACGSMRIALASGNTRLREIAAGIRVQSASGDVAADSVSGALAVRSASGDVAILRHRGGAFTAETASGDVRWRPDGVAEARIRTVSGDIAVETPADSGWRVAFRSVSGSASLPARFGLAGRNAWTATGADADEGSIEARTVSGDLRVTDLAAGAGDAEESPEAAPPRDRDAILRAVERGHLGVEEALRLLDDLSGAQPA